MLLFLSLRSLRLGKPIYGKVLGKVGKVRRQDAMAIETDHERVCVISMRKLYPLEAGVAGRVTDAIIDWDFSSSSLTDDYMGMENE